MALSPCVEYALGRRGLLFLRPEDTHDPRALERYGDEAFATVERACAMADACWQREIRYVGANELRPAWSLFFYVKILYDSVALRLFELDRMLVAQQVARVLVPETSTAACDERMFWLEESVYAHVIRLLAEARGIPVESVPVPPAQDPAHAPWRSEPAERPGLKARLRSVALLQGPWHLARLVRETGSFRVSLTAANALVTGGAEGGGAPILFCSSSYGLSAAMADLLREGAAPWVWDDEGRSEAFGLRRGAAPGRRTSAIPSPARDLDTEAAGAWDLLRGDGAFRALFRSKEIDWFALVEPRLKVLATRGVARIAAEHARAAAVLDEVRPRAVVFATMVGAWAKAVAHAARQRAIPVVVVPHGEIGTHRVPILYFNDLVTADWYCVGGSGVERHLRREYGESPRTVVVGSPMLDGLAARAPSRARLCRRYGLDPARRIVLYNLTALDGNYRYLTRRQPSDSRQYEIHRRIVGTLGAHPAVHVVVKPHPARGSRSSPIEDAIRDGGPANCTVLAEPHFADLIHLADAFIIDCPSTSLLQMCATDTPIYVFNDWFQWDPEALEALERRALVFADLDAFCRALGADLASGACFERRRVDRTFWRRFAVPEDGMSAGALARFLSALPAPASAAP